MFRFEIHGDNITVTDAIRNYIEEKLSKLERYFTNVPEANAHVKIKTYQDGKSKVEVTIPLKNVTLRAEERHNDLYAAVDLIVEKLERQMRKHKTKVNRKFREKGVENDIFPVLPGTEPEEEKGDEIEIIRSKQFDLKPMDAEEAVLQMNMLGHDFFIFNDGETNETNIVYKRKDGKYGLIETSVER
ncbi:MULTISPECIES: ribosome hibernation-promoting factor, HPF/YfiA family [Macrococcus]|uniref:Ribosome hibernation promoting factor n=1 Tax=Macrococcus psychrotolerans TaxID=3039389 RepID=A0AAU6R9U6_9STAP|nr:MULTISPECIES: ribosome-associated translation inhibitor RaiA [Macrococcus]MDJ1111120.1 ribosome-associated translation inhibitor RaiA [Macrococcus sp. S115]QYA33358.1 ribosome-associated translation inhibitor RaiA [Macrococcus sp. 19Msa1099]QYA38173.1 ribosome-associated translation inhibitor RaiA [Macrococcus caseolyticus]QYA76880.1 ribosome-associated translation inhibitor RaiA [Macrococcus caseolyticus]